LDYRFDRLPVPTSLAQKRARWLAAAVSLSAWLVLACVATLAQATSSSTGKTGDPPAKSAAKTTPKTADAKPVATGPLVKSYGSVNAPIKLDVFTDYQCPSCRNFYETTLRQLIGSDYITSGKVYLVHHDFPLQAHMYSGMAARWANAAARVGEFPEVEAALYDNQDAWGSSGDIAKYVSAAMPAADFKRVEALVKSCDSPPPTSTWDHGNPLAKDAHPCPFDYAIADDIQLGYKVPVQATPTYVITFKGQKLPAGSGTVSWPILKQFFDSLLAQP
jgi:protein-disulfide isomerase